MLKSAPRVLLPENESVRIPVPEFMELAKEGRISFEEVSLSRRISVRHCILKTADNCSAVIDINGGGIVSWRIGGVEQLCTSRRKTGLVGLGGIQLIFPRLGYVPFGNRPFANPSTDWPTNFCQAPRLQADPRSGVRSEVSADGCRVSISFSWGPFQHGSISFAVVYSISLSGDALQCQAEFLNFGAQDFWQQVAFNNVFDTHPTEATSMYLPARHSIMLLKNWRGNRPQYVDRKTIRFKTRIPTEGETIFCYVPSEFSVIRKNRLPLKIRLSNMGEFATSTRTFMLEGKKLRWASIQPGRITEPLIVPAYNSASITQEIRADTSGRGG